MAGRRSDINSAVCAVSGRIGRDTLALGILVVDIVWLIGSDDFIIIILCMFVLFTPTTPGIYYLVSKMIKSATR